MANRTPHVVGGGLGTFRKEGQAKHAQQAEAERKAANKAAMAALVKSVTK